MQTGKVVLLVDPAEGPAAGGQPRRYRFDPTRPDALLARALVHDALERAAGRGDRTAALDAPRTAPGTRYIDFVVPGLICFNLMSAGLWGVGFVIVEMRVKRLLKRMLATPMRRTHFLFSFVVVRGAFSLVELPVLAGFAALVFKMPIRGSLLLLTALTILGSLSFAAMGLLVAARSTTVQTAGGLINLATLSMTICSGVFFSVERFPTFLQQLIQLLPLTAFIDAMRAIMLEGAGLHAIAGELAILSVWGGVCFFLALRLFRWR
jgi:ABC-type multidrug transport system permease subunit